jgi:hypothetical protein
VGGREILTDVVAQCRASSRSNASARCGQPAVRESDGRREQPATNTLTT